MRRLSSASIASAVAALLVPAAQAAEEAGQPPHEDNPAWSDVLRQIEDLGGLRPPLADAGVQLTFSYDGDALGNPSGGVKQTLTYEGRLGAIIDADLDKLVAWSGAAFHASIHQIHGQGLSGSYVQNLMTVSGIEAPATTRLFNLWIEQEFAGGTTLRLGQFTAAQEFLVSENANLFVNATFGWPAIVAVDLPSGGPAYPEATPGARLKFDASDHVAVLAAIFDGDPAGSGRGNPFPRDPHGLAFRVNDPPLLLTEIDYGYGQAHNEGNPYQEGSMRPPSAPRKPPSVLPGMIKLGAWYHTGRFADQRFDAQGLSLADPRSSGQPLMHRGDVGVYAVLDQMLWRAAGDADEALNGFLRVSASPSDRNPIDRYVDAGVTYKGLIPRRPDDLVGIGFAFARISPRAAAVDRDTIAFTGSAIPVRDHEAAIELTYQGQLAERWSVQPVFQYILHPGGNVPNPRDPQHASPIPDAAVVGLRTTIKF